MTLNESTSNEAATRVVIDSGQPLSRSLIWEMQRRYFVDQGIEAWRSNIVPSYITSNPSIAQSYARLVLGYLRDGQASLDPSQPVYIVELGAGGGRFAFHFLRAFEPLIAASPFAALNYCYVLTDLPERNVTFWQSHPAFQQWVQAGHLDFARFDALADKTITLRHTGKTIGGEQRANPLIFIANYFFDSLPQDAFHIEQGRLQECQIKLTSAQEEPDPGAAEVLPRVMIHFLTQQGDLRGYYQDDDLDRVLEEYRALENSYVLFGADAIRLVRGLTRLAGGRLLLLCGDYGPTTVRAWEHNGAPDVRIHGSISMEVNFHALGAFIQNQGGRFLAPDFRARYLTVCAFALDESANDFAELSLAYREAVNERGPNEFFLLKRGMENSYPALSLEEMVGFLRFGGWDPHLFLDCFPYLLEKLSSITQQDQEELAAAVEQVWKNYYNLGEERDLPFSIGVVLFRIDRAKEALPYFEQSLADYGPSPMTLYNIALCLVEHDRLDEARDRVREALALDPNFETAQLLEKELNKGR